VNRKERRKAIKQNQIKGGLLSQADIDRLKRFPREKVLSELSKFYRQNNCSNLERGAIRRELKMRGVL